MCDLNDSYVWHDSFICVTWLLHACDTTHSYVWHGSFICVTWRIDICVTWLIHLCDMTHSYVWHDSFICVTWLRHACDMTHLYVYHYSFMYAAWRDGRGGGRYPGFWYPFWGRTHSLVSIFTNTVPLADLHERVLEDIWYRNIVPVMQ